MQQRPFPTSPPFRRQRRRGFGNRSLAALASIALGTAAASGCTDGSTGSDPGGVPTPAVAGDPLFVADGTLRDGTGRQLLLRGVNARVRGLFDVTFDDGRTALEPIPPLTRQDCRFLARDMGFNLLRLPVNWSGIEPERGTYDEDYLDAIAATAAGCAAEGIRTLVDLHQDAWSKHIGEDGAPLWAIVPPPEELLEGPLHDLEARRASGQVLAAFDSFFDNAEGLQDAYAEMAGHLATRIAGVTGVIGLELMNEPVVGPGDEARLDAFHAKVAAAVRAAAPGLTVFFEPNSLRNFADEAKVRGPFPVSDAVYAPHLYTGVFQGDWERGDVARIAKSVTAAREEAAEYGVGLLVGEWGNNPRTVTGTAWVESALEIFDRQGISWAFWVYEEWSQGSWGLYDAVTEPEPGRTGLREGFADLLARPYPAAISGRRLGFAFNPGTKVLRVELAPAGDGPHRIAVPDRHYPLGVKVRCDGVLVDDLERGPGWVEARCGGAELEVLPR